MSVTATPTLTLGALTIAATLAGDPQLVAIDELRLTWGRGSVLEQPTPATVALTVLDRSPTRDLARRTDLIGQPVVLGYSIDGAAAIINFRGRVTDAAATPTSHGWRVAIAASSLEVDLANQLVPEGTAFPAEQFSARLTRILGLRAAGSLTGGALLPTRLQLGVGTAPTVELDAATAAPVDDAGGSSILELLRELFTSTAPLAVVYDPRFDSLGAAPRRRFAYQAAAGMTYSAGLYASPDNGGRYVAAANSGTAGTHLDAGLTGYAGALTQGLDSRLTRVEVSYHDGTISYAQRTMVAPTDDTPLEGTIGRRTLTVQSAHGDTTSASRLANLYADVVNREARTPRLAQLSYSTAREPLHGSLLAAALLSGYETGTALFLNDSWLPQLGQRPLVGVLGATVVYSGGHWSVDFTPAPVIVDPTPNLWGPVTIGALASSTAVTLGNLDPSVTLGDLGYLEVGAGFTPLTVQPYKGNPA